MVVYNIGHDNPELIGKYPNKFYPSMSEAWDNFVIWSGGVLNLDIRSTGLHKKGFYVNVENK